MSKPLKYDKSKTAQQLQGLFNEVCFRLGQEIRNEQRAKDNQIVLMEQQEELEKAYTSAVQREQEEAANNAKATVNTEAFEAKAPSTATPEAS